jgi:hypothetical protein
MKIGKLWQVDKVQGRGVFFSISTTTEALRRDGGRNGEH